MLILMLFLLTGCIIPAAIIGGAGVVGYKLSSRKGPKGYVNDVILKRKIIKTIRARNMPILPILIFDGKVMFGGHTNIAERYINAIKTIPGVEKIIDKTHSINNTIKNRFEDSMIKTYIKSALLLNVHVQSRNVRIKVYDHIVYVLGKVFVEDEKRQIIQTLMNVANVQRVEYDIDVIPEDQEV